MSRNLRLAIAASGLAAILAAGPAGAVTVFHFNNGAPDGRLGALSQPAAEGRVQTEVADDFNLASETRLTHATFTGLVAAGTPLSALSNVEIEFYHLFPAGSDPNRKPAVPTRVNSPGDTEIAGATRDGSAGGLAFDDSLVSERFSVANSVTTGVEVGPATGIGGDGGFTGEEVTINVDFTTPVTLDAGHYFFRPEADFGASNFLWLSSPKGPLPPGSPPDLQAWMRNDNLAPDWLRIGADITRQAPVNMAFTLTGVGGVPEPTTWALMIVGVGLAGASLRHHRKALRVA